MEFIFSAIKEFAFPIILVVTVGAYFIWLLEPDGYSISKGDEQDGKSNTESISS